MAVLDDIRDGKGLKPITFNCYTCQNGNCIASGSKTATYQCPGYKHKRTNAEHIRNMTDEEMADELLEWYAVFSAVEWTKDMILNWLKKEYKE